MSKEERMLMNLCLQDQLFCSMYGGLEYMHEKYALPSPYEIWLQSMFLTQEIHASPRPDLAAEQILREANVCVLASLLYIEMTQDMEHALAATELKDTLCRKLEKCKHWPELYREIEKSEEKEENCGRYVTETDYLQKELPPYGMSNDGSIRVEEIVETAIKMGDPQFEHGVAYLLRRIGDQHGGSFREHILRLERHADESFGKTAEQLGEIAQQQRESKEVLEKAANRNSIGQVVLEQNNWGIGSEKARLELEDKTNNNKLTYNG